MFFFVKEKIDNLLSVYMVLDFLIHFILKVTSAGINTVCGLTMEFPHETDEEKPFQVCFTEY